MRLQASEALAARRVEADHVKVWQTVGKPRRRHGLVMSGEPRYRVVDWLWEAKRVRSTWDLQGLMDSLVSIAGMMRASEASMRSGSTPS